MIRSIMKFSQGNNFDHFLQWDNRIDVIQSKLIVTLSGDPENGKGVVEFSRLFLFLTRESLIQK